MQNISILTDWKNVYITTVQISMEFETQESQPESKKRLNL